MTSRKVLAWIGLLGTLFYLICLLWVTHHRIAELHNLGLNEIGDFFAGVFSPLALFWLILGFLLQSLELHQNSESLNLQAKELKASTEQQQHIALAHHASLDNYANSLVPLLKLRAGDTICDDDGEEYLQVDLENLGEYCECVEVHVGKGHPFHFDALFSSDKVGFLLSIQGESEPFSRDIAIHYVTRTGETGIQNFVLAMLDNQQGFYFAVKKLPFVRQRKGSEQIGVQPATD